MITRLGTYSQIKGSSVKLPCKVATTTSITLNGTQTIDGVAVVSGERVLVKNQASAATNGIYIVASGAWTRAVDMSLSEDVFDGVQVFVNSGSTNSEKTFVLVSDDPIVLGTTDLTFNQIASGSVTINNNADNRVITGSNTSNTLNGEANLTFDGTVLTVTGDVVATTKSFDIIHPTKEGFRLRYGVLEGPEHGVYLRGYTKDDTIILPDYWINLVYQDSITVQLTPKNTPIIHYVKDVVDNKVHIGSTNGTIDTYFIVFAERKDIPKFDIEYPEIS